MRLSGCSVLVKSNDYSIVDSFSCDIHSISSLMRLISNKHHLKSSRTLNVYLMAIKDDFVFKRCYTLTPKRFYRIY